MPIRATVNGTPELLRLPARRRLDGWPSPPDRFARIAAVVGGYWLGVGSADELAAAAACAESRSGDG